MFHEFPMFFHNLPIFSPNLPIVSHESPIFSRGLPIESSIFSPLFGPAPKRSPSEGDSFDTISSVGSNTSVVHYKPEKASCKKLSKDEMYLIETWVDLQLWPELYQL